MKKKVEVINFSNFFLCFVEGPHKRITFRDMSSEELCQKSCQVLQVVVSTYFLKNLKKDKIIMKHHGLGPVGCKAIAAPLVVSNSFVLVLSLYLP